MDIIFAECYQVDDPDAYLGVGALNKAIDVLGWKVDSVEDAENNCFNLSVPTGTYQRIEDVGGLSITIATAESPRIAISVNT